MSKGKLKDLPKKRRPKSSCCVSRPKCKRCPIAMLQAGTLPDGWSVRKRKLVRAS